MALLQLGSVIRIMDNSIGQPTTATILEYRMGGSSTSVQYRISYNDTARRQWISDEELRGKILPDDPQQGKEGPNHMVAGSIAAGLNSSAMGGYTFETTVRKAEDAMEVDPANVKSKKATGTKVTSKIIDWDYDSLPVKIPLPPQLRKQLNDDHSLIHQGKELVPLPRTPSVSDILENWTREYASTEQSDAPVITMLKTLFQHELGNHLLYRLERFQHAEFMSRNPGLSVDKAYGAEHLLRLFVILPWFLSNTQLADDVIHNIKMVVANLMEYMRLNMGTFFCQEYEPASAAALLDAGLS
jgi:mortality factor 4-like protein 1